MTEMLKLAKAAKIEIARLTATQKNRALEAMADSLIANETAILAACSLVGSMTVLHRMRKEIPSMYPVDCLLNQMRRAV